MGDNWNNALLMSSITSSHSVPDIKKYFHKGDEANPFTINICVDPGLESVVSLSVQKIKENDIIENPWEIIWFVTANDGRIFQSGTFNTTMTFIYAPQSWNLLSATNLGRGTFDCPSQIGGLRSTCPSSSTTILNPLLSLDNGDNDKSHNDPNTDTTQLQIQTFDTLSEGWFRTDGLGASWYITDQSRCQALAVGTMLSGQSSQIITISIPEGSYYFRVTGSLDKYAKDYYWFFCGVYGSAGDELSFFLE
jgi:hypothetical protein